ALARGRRGDGGKHAKGEHQRKKAIAESAHAGKPLLKQGGGGGSAASPHPSTAGGIVSRSAAALLGNGVVVAALEGLPVPDQVLGFRKVFRPGIARDEVLGLPHHVELPVAAHLADEHRLGNMVVRQHFRYAAGEV